MTQQQTNIQVVAPGFAGINTQDAPVGLPLAFALQADNCVIDKFGRIASRKGVQAYSLDPEDGALANVGTNSAETAFEYVERDGTRYVLFSGDNQSSNSQVYLQNTSSGAVTTLATPGFASANNWDYASLSDICYLAQSGESMYSYDGTTFQDWFAATEAPAALVGGTPGAAGLTQDDPNIVLSAFGRLFIAGASNNKSTVQWSVITTNTGLGATPWSGAGAGLINIEEYWPNGQDEIVALAEHNGFLVIFGRRSIVIYSVPMDQTASSGPAFMELVDAIENIGCIARDSVVSTGTDVFFLDASGLRSLNRTIQEKSVPIGDASANVRDDLKVSVSSVAFPIRACYSPEEAVVLLFLPRSTAEASETYVFDTRRPLENGALRTTLWKGKGLRCGVRIDDGRLFLGRAGGLYTYTGGNDTSLLSTEDATSDVMMNYLTTQQVWEQPAMLKFPKQCDIVLIGGSSLDLRVSWYFDYKTQENFKTISRSVAVGGQWGTAQWGNYNEDPPGAGSQWGEAGGIISEEKVNLWGSGKVVQFGFSGNITSQQISIQELNIQALLGRLL